MRYVAIRDFGIEGRCVRKGTTLRIPQNLTERDARVLVRMKRIELAPPEPARRTRRDKSTDSVASPGSIGDS